MNDNNPQDFQQEQQQSVDYKVLLFKFYRYWYFFAITVFIALIIAFIFNKYTSPVYEVKTSILIKDKSENKLSAQSIMGLGGLNNMQNLQNEIGVLSSYTLTYRTIAKIGFEISYFSEENFISKEIYKDSPFTVEIDTVYPQPVNMRFNISIASKDKYRLEAKEEDIKFYNFSKKDKVPGRKERVAVDETFEFGKWVQGNNFRFRLLLTPMFNQEKDLTRTFFFQINDYESLVTQYKGFSIEPINKEASIVEIKLKGGNVNKLADFLDALGREYLTKDLERKNLVAGRTIKFIDNELQGISDTLHSTEKALEVFRTNKEIMNLDDVSKQVFEKMMELQDEKAVLLVQSKYLSNLAQYLERNQKLDELVVPASMGVENPMLNDLTMKLTDLYTKRTEISQYSKGKNPTLLSIDQQISTIKNALVENIKSAINTNNIALKEINDRVAQYTSKISTLPETQRVLFGIERRFKLTDAIYTYLMQNARKPRSPRLQTSPTMKWWMLQWVVQAPSSPRKA